MPVAIGILLGPFLFAFVAVTLFALAPGLPLWSYPSIAGGVLLATRFAATMLSRAPTACGRATASRRATGMERFWLGCLLVWIAAAVTSAIVHPLLQNDALEYMMVASELARVRDLSIYPLVNADASISGFFAPWTHPPLFVSTLAAVMGLESTLGSMGSARLVSVWFLSAAVAGTVGLGRTRSQLDGTLGGVVLVSTPLLFLGADSSLVDSLPVEPIRSSSARQSASHSGLIPARSSSCPSLQLFWLGEVGFRHGAAPPSTCQPCWCSRR